MVNVRKSINAFKRARNLFKNGQIAQNVQSRTSQDASGAENARSVQSLRAPNPQ